MRDANPSFSVRIAASALLVCNLAACAGLHPVPPAEAHATHAPTVVKTVVKASKGPLESNASDAALKRIEAEGDTDLVARHIASMESVLRSPIVIGNSARLLVDGPATHEAMFAAIDAARDNINLESYIIDEEAGKELASRLLAKRAAGVTVNLLYDSVGSVATPAEYFDSLRAGGINVCEFNPINPLSARVPWRLNNRDHRKVLVVDGRIAFAGGINISSVYYSSGSFGHRREKVDTRQGWRDTHVELRGPVVAELQKTFLSNWARQNCDPLPPAHYVVTNAPKGDKAIRVIASGPGSEGSTMFRALVSAIEHAERRVYLTMAYFVPDPHTLEALKGAAQRGVDVRLALPGFSDFWAPFYAGRSHYASLLKAKVRIFERKDALLHAKTAVIDSVWSTIGSTNMDWRSYVHNEELDILVLDAEFAAEMDKLFRRDIEASVEIDAETWSQRGPGTRLLEWVARWWEYLL